MQIKLFPSIGIIIMIVLVLAAIVLTCSLYRWGRAPFAPPGDTAGFARAAQQLIDDRLNGNIAFVLLDDTGIAHEYYATRAPDAETITRDTPFQLASLSKWVTAWGVLSLVDQGVLELDAPVQDHLTRWQFPESTHDNSDVTVRRLLSHSAGLTDRLGYQGFQSASAVQSLEESLHYATDSAEHAHSGPLRVERTPGSRWQYSGGGYTLLQLLIEEASGESFDDYMHSVVLEPLGMHQASYRLSPAIRDQLAVHFTTEGQQTYHRHFASQASSSLHASPQELARFAAAHFPGSDGQPAGRGIISPQMIDEMLSPQISMFGIDLWGLGPILYDLLDTGHSVFGHDGHNSPGISTTLRIDRVTRDGIIVLSSGDPALATELGNEWYYWNTGTLDQAALAQQFPRIGGIILAGAALINAAGILLYRRRR